MDIPGILNSVRDQLEKKNIPPETREFILELLEELMTSMAGYIDINAHPDALQRLVDALISNRNILTTLQRQSTEMDALKRITRNLTATLELQTVLDGVVQEALQLVTDAQDAHIFLFQNDHLSFGASLFNDGRKNIQFAEPRPEGLTYQVARQKKLIVVEDLQNSPLYVGSPATWTGSIIGIPLMMGDQVFGVMNLARTQSGVFSHSEVRLLNLLADQAAIAIVNARLHEAVIGQALKDSLTGLPNRHALDLELDTEIKRASRTGHEFAVVMMDLDGFKKVNDDHGHEIGDEVLRQIAQSFKQVLRTTDFIARYGGDELTLLLPDTGWPQAEVVTDKIVEQIKSLAIPLPGGKTTNLSITGGVAIYPLHALTASNLLRAADEALYRAKRHRRGKFQLAHRGTGQLLSIK